MKIDCIMIYLQSISLSLAWRSPLWWRTRTQTSHWTSPRLSTHTSSNSNYSQQTPKIGHWTYVQRLFLGCLRWPRLQSRGCKGWSLWTRLWKEHQHLKRPETRYLGLPTRPIQSIAMSMSLVSWGCHRIEVHHICIDISYGVISDLPFRSC